MTSRDEYNQKVGEARAAIVDYLKENEEADALKMYDDISPRPSIDRKFLAAAMCELTLTGEVSMDGKHVVRLA